MHMSSDPFAWNAAQRQDGSNEKSTFVRTGLQKEKQARFPVPAACNLAEEGGFEPP